MKITGAKVYVGGPGKNYVTLKIMTDQGIYGLGDATLNNRETVPAAYLQDYLIPNLIGMDPRTSEDIWQFFYRGAYFRGGPIAMAAFGAIDMALWDIKGKLAGMPLYQLFGGKSRDGAMVYAHATGADLPDLMESVTHYIEQGYQAVRVQCGIPGMPTASYAVPAEKGGKGDFITDFRDTVEDETVIKRLINEAYIEFYVDESSTASQTEFPNRVFVYDLNNNIPLIDYFLDSSVNPATSDSKFSHLVPLGTETDDDGNEYKKYKVRLTGHLDNIVAKDSTNVKIGLLISSNVGAADMKKLQQYDEDVEAIPMGTILSPRSVILQGSNSNDELKKVKLRVYYTEPNN